MGGRSSNFGRLNRRSNKSSFYETEEDLMYAWTMDPPDKGTPEYREMVSKLNEFIGDSKYSGTAYRGLEFSSEEEFNKAFPGVDASVKLGQNELVSLTASRHSAVDFATQGFGSVPVILVIEGGVSNSRIVPGTEDMGGMQELLTKNSNNYKITKIQTERLHPNDSSYDGYEDDFAKVVYLKQKRK